MFSERTTTDRADRFGDCCLPEYGSVAIDKDKTLFHGGRGNDGADVTDRGNVDGTADVIKAQAMVSATGKQEVATAAAAARTARRAAQADLGMQLAPACFDG